MTSTTRSERSRMSSKAPRLRVSTPLSSGRRPVTAATSSARSASSAANADPTVPCPRSPTRKGSDIAHGHVVVGLAAHHEARVAARDEDDRRARDAVVRVRHRVPVRAGRRRDDHVARARVVEVGVVDEDVAGLAVLADEVAARAAARAPDDLRLVARAVEHRAQVVGHAAVDRHVGHDVALDRLDGVERHGRVRDEGAPGLVEDPLARPGELLDRVDLEGDVLLDARRPVDVGVGDAEAAAEVEHGEVAEVGERGDGGAERGELDDLRADVEVQPLEDQLVGGHDAVDRGRRGVEVEAELRVRAAGGDRRVRVRADAGRDAHLHRLTLARRADLLEALDVAVVVEHDVADAGVGHVVLDNDRDIERLEEIGAPGERQAVQMRIAPGVSPDTHPSISTGGPNTKFGFNLDAAAPAIDRVMASDKLVLEGLHFHIGSQIVELAPFRPAIAALADLGDFPMFNLGGGLGVAYTEFDAPPSIEEYVAFKVDAVEQLAGLGKRVLDEPGRALVANSTVTLYSVESVKRNVMTYVAVDGGMSDNLRPMLYGARYEAQVVGRPGGGTRCHLVGKHCES